MTELLYLVAASGFFLGLKYLSSPKTARMGNLLSALAMGLGAGVTWFIAAPSNIIIILSIILLGGIVGVVSAQRVALTAMPQLVAIFNGLGGGASVLVSCAESLRFYYDQDILSNRLFSFTSWFGVVVGGITLSGSLIAFLKLQNLINQRPIIFIAQRFTTLVIFLLCLIILYKLAGNPEDIISFLILAGLAILLGVLLVIPIGGADMPVVISLLNSYSGVAVLAAGFVVNNKLLIISGSLVGASGIILTQLMCQAMNRSLTNVVFGAFKKNRLGDSTKEVKPMREFTPIDAALLLKNSNNIIIIPGYGLAVSQAQNNIRELSDKLLGLGINISYAIHPVAGRMPGHMNVLLAEADVPYEQLYDLDNINSEFAQADTVIIIGANDVVNPVARTDSQSPLYGMPILNADKARSIIVLKRGQGRGFANIENPLFTSEKTGVVFGDAKASLINILNSLQEI